MLALHRPLWWIREAFLFCRSPQNWVNILVLDCTQWQKITLGMVANWRLLPWKPNSKSKTSHIIMKMMGKSKSQQPNLRTKTTIMCSLVRHCSRKMKITFPHMGGFCRPRIVFQQSTHNWDILSKSSQSWMNAFGIPKCLWNLNPTYTMSVWHKQRSLVCACQQVYFIATWW